MSNPDTQTQAPAAAINDPMIADLLGDPDFDLFEPDGGLTAEAQDFLGDIDRDGGFI